MSVLLSDDFFSSIAALQGNEKVRVWDFVGQFQADPAHPSISLERLKRASDGVWSGRVSQELRAIIYKDGDTWALLHAGHHDAAYEWAERRKVGRHSVTGALQIVDTEHITETVKQFVPSVPTADDLFHAHADDYLLSLGVPEEWMPAIRAIKIEDHLLAACEKLPPDVAERLLALATGEFVAPPPTAKESGGESPDTGRRFYLIQDLEEMRVALDAPLEKWISFLHPSQKRLVEGTFNGPVKVTGSAGTGKTVVALHRANKLAKAGHRVLVTTYMATLKENLESSLSQLVPDEIVRGRIEVSTVHAAALRIVKRVEPKAHPASSKRINDQLEMLMRTQGLEHDLSFVTAEWENVIQSQGIDTWDGYREANRVGRGSPLSIPQRKKLWNVFEECRERFAADSSYSWTDLCIRGRDLLTSGEVNSEYEGVIVDELQDLSAAEIGFLWALGQSHPGHFMVVGDAGQRIYPGGFSLRRLGLEVRGRSHVLRVNYRTTEQIRRTADTMLGSLSDDMDGGQEDRSKTRSLLRGPSPRFQRSADSAAELVTLGAAVDEWLLSGLAPEAIAVFARTNDDVAEIETMLKSAGHSCLRLKNNTSLSEPGVRVGTMHRAKGLEFKVVAVVHCGANDLPRRSTLNRHPDPQDREAAIERERRLLYVAMTRARDELLITWNGEPSRFLEPILDGAQSE